MVNIDAPELVYGSSDEYKSSSKLHSLRVGNRIHGLYPSIGDGKISVSEEMPRTGKRAAIPLSNWNEYGACI